MKGNANKVLVEAFVTGCRVIIIAATSTAWVVGSSMRVQALHQVSVVVKFYARSDWK